MTAKIRFLVMAVALLGCDVDDRDEMVEVVDDQGGWCTDAAYPGSLGCPCPADGCLENLECMDGVCGPCPNEQEGCACGPDATCEPGLVCTDENVCKSG
jgi:hypothetical protein